MSVITLNGSGSTPQPTTVKEEKVQIQQDRVRVDGSVQRNYLGTKWQATLTYPKLAPADYQTLLTMFAGAVTVTYVNSLSAATGGSLSFTGLANFNEGEYIPGTTVLKPFTVVLRQV